MTTWTPPRPRRWRVLRRYGPWVRRTLALICLALAAVTAGRAKAATPPAAMTATLVAAHPVPAGAVLTADDLTLQPWPVAVRPAVALDTVAAALGHRVNVALGSGEAVTSTRLVDPSTWSLRAGQTAATITLADESGAALLHAGDVIDLIAGAEADDALASVGSGVDATGPRPVAGAGAVVADGVIVLQVLAANSAAIASDHSTQIVIGVDRSTAIRLAATLGAPMLATVHPPQ